MQQAHFYSKPGRRSRPPPRQRHSLSTEKSESPMFVCHSYLRTSIAWLSATVVVRPRQLIQRLSASFVFLSTTFSGKTAPFISPSRNKTNASAMLASVNMRSKTPQYSRNAARASGCCDGWRHRAMGLFELCKVCINNNICKDRCKMSNYITQYENNMCMYTSMGQ